MFPLEKSYDHNIICSSRHTGSLGSVNKVNAWQLADTETNATRGPHRRAHAFPASGQRGTSVPAPSLSGKGDETWNNPPPPCAPAMTGLLTPLSLAWLGRLQHLYRPRTWKKRGRGGKETQRQEVPLRSPETAGRWPPTAWSRRGPCLRLVQGE